MLANLDLQKLVFGRLTLEAIPYHEPILLATFAGVAIGGVALLGALTYFRLWGYLWKEWFTSVDHKRIGIMYMVLGPRHAGARVLRRPADALAAGDRVRHRTKATCRPTITTRCSRRTASS